MIDFQIHADDVETRARRGTLITAHGPVETPAFMPVGTRATVTGMSPADLRELRAQMILGNTYHLLLRPGPDELRRVGGLHRFMRWDGPILTDSGGFQIFSMPGQRTITEDGAAFRSYVDGSVQHLSPERSIEVQQAIDSDVMMVLDVCLPSTSGLAEIRSAMDRTHRWALRSLAARTNPKQALFAIVQGGLDNALRTESAQFLTAHPFDGFAIGGLAVGDTRHERGDVIAHTARMLPAGRPRYLMGVGTPPDILEGIARGIDLFDCVIPTSLAWQGTAFTSRGRVKITRTEYKSSDAPLDADCRCSTCTTFTRGYLRHLMVCKEPLGPRLLSFHNLHYYLDLARAARQAIQSGRYGAFMKETLAAIDRHEHAEGQPGRRHLVITTRSGAPAVRDMNTGEVMHPVVGARAEAEQLYAKQSKLRERLLAADAAPGAQPPLVPTQPPPLVLFDVGLGAASNALAARRISEELAAAAPSPTARRLVIISFEQDLGALQLALQPENAAAFGLDGEPGEAARALLANGLHETARTTWRLLRGDAIELLKSPAFDERADVVFWDPFSPESNPGLWTVGAFAAVRARCGPRATLFTYSASTTTRMAMLLAGWSVGVGAPSGPAKQTTVGAIDHRDLETPLGSRFLERLARTSAPLPSDAPADAISRIGAMAQFA